MIAILCENYAGKWPFWLSPNQIAIIPIQCQNEKLENYAQDVKLQLETIKLCVEIFNNPSETLNKRVRNAQCSHFNFILVIGEQECESNTVNVRTRDNVQHGQKSLSQVLDLFLKLKNEKLNDEHIKF